MDENFSSSNTLYEPQIKSQQQFCLKWHNHQTSLLSTLPLLLDQSHLTDVTISAESRYIQAHRIVLSACSSFFSELFKTLDTKNHPIIIIPGATFGAIISLLTFMYSGEVNVYEEQIPNLLSLAETLGIKGLSDVHENVKKKPPDNDGKDSPALGAIPSFSCSSSSTLHSVMPQSNAEYPINFPLLTKNLPFEVLQSFHNYSEPLNLSEETFLESNDLVNKTRKCDHSSFTPFLKRQSFKNYNFEDSFKPKKIYISGEGHQKIMSDINPIKFQNTSKFDKIMESFLATNNNIYNRELCDHKKYRRFENDLENITSMSAIDFLQPVSSQISSPNIFNPYKTVHHSEKPRARTSNLQLIEQINKISSLDKVSTSLKIPPIEGDVNILKVNMEAPVSVKSQTVSSPQQNKASQSKLFATCLICHKQLSNQYNLRVHMETHQNVRYSCSVCSHVSRSKDALRKHISYRHPSTQQSGEHESRRKRSLKSYSNTVGSVSHCLSSSSCGDLSSTISSMQTDTLNVIHATELSSKYMMLAKHFNIEPTNVIINKQQHQKHVLDEHSYMPIKTRVISTTVEDHSRKNVSSVTCEFKSTESVNSDSLQA